MPTMSSMELRLQKVTQSMDDFFKKIHAKYTMKVEMQDKFEEM
jgi:hypothetical protein